MNLQELIHEAASDSGGARPEPRLYEIALECVRPDRPDSLRQHAIEAAMDYAAVLDTATPNEFTTFLSFLSRAELVADSPRLQGVLLAAVDRHSDAVTRTWADLAIMLLRRGFGKEYTQQWFGRLKAQIARAPDWPVLDLLAELRPYVGAYSMQDFLADLETLSARSDFDRHIELRKSKWMRLEVPLGSGVAVAKSGTALVHDPLLPNLDTWFEGMTTSQHVLLTG